MPWISEDNLLIYTYNDYTHTPKCRVLFDLDSTLITTISGRVFSNRFDDWKFYPGVEKFLRNIKKDITICIISNQAGLKNDEMVANFKKKIRSIVKEMNSLVEYNVCIIATFAISKDVVYRKPFPGMLDIIRNYIKISNNAIYIGDAAGRSSDHSSVDRNLAYNANLSFQTPEEFFLNQSPDENYNQGFIPEEYNPEPQELPKFNVHKKYFIILIGPPGSGKSELAKKLVDEYEFIHLSQDNLGSETKVLKTIKNNKSSSIIIDCINANIKKRKVWIDAVPSINHKIILLEMTTPLEVAQHNNYIRARKTGKLIPDIVYRIYKKNYEEPNKNIEHYDKHIKYNFVPEFTSISEKHEWELITP